eukprot:sb/3466639/
MVHQGRGTHVRWKEESRLCCEGEEKEKSLYQRITDTLTETWYGRKKEGKKEDTTKSKDTISDAVKDIVSHRVSIKLEDNALDHLEHDMSHKSDDETLSHSDDEMVDDIMSDLNSIEMEYQEHTLQSYFGLTTFVPSCDYVAREEDGCQYDGEVGDWTNCGGDGAKEVFGGVSARQVYQNPLFFEVNFYSYLIVNLNNSGSVRPVWTNLVSNACYRSDLSCTAMAKFRLCQGGSCPCELSPWSEWGECGGTCPDNRSRLRHRDIVSNPDGAECGAREEREECLCGCGEWGEWGDCDPLCEDGTTNMDNMKTTRYRYIILQRSSVNCDTTKQ